MKLSALAQALGVRLDNPTADDPEITSVAGIEEASPGQITFVSNPKYGPAAKTTRASAVIVSPDFPAIPTATLRSENPYLTFARALEIFYHPPQYAPGVHPTAVMHPTAKIGSNAHIGPYVVIDEDVELGDNCVLLAHVVIYRGARIGHNFFAHAHAVVREDCRLGDNVVLQNGAIVGCDGFGFANDKGHWVKIPQSGPVIMGNDVEVQANTCVDRATVGETRVGNGVKIDNQVQVGHACEIGDDTLLCAQVGLAGSTVLGRHNILAGRAAVAGHCTFGDGVILTANSAISHSVEAGRTMSGYPAIDNKLWLRCTAAYNRLPEIVREMRALSAAVKKLAPEDTKE